MQRRRYHSKASILFGDATRGPCSGVRRTIVALALLVLCATPLGAECTQADVARARSPDGIWEAVNEEFTCDVGLFSTDITTEVHLRSTHKPIRDFNLLGVDTTGNVNERPRLAWTSAHVLRVTVRNISILKVLLRRTEGIWVDLHFDPDDPKARARWLRAHDMPPDQRERP